MKKLKVNCFICEGSGVFHDNVSCQLAIVILDTNILESILHQLDWARVVVQIYDMPNILHAL